MWHAGGVERGCDGPGPPQKGAACLLAQFVSVSGDAPGKVRSLSTAAAFVDRVGLALVFGKGGVVLPSLYEAVAGPGPVMWAEEREDGKLAFTPELSMIWAWKDELAEARLACAGKHIRGWPSLVSLALLPALYALTGRAGLPSDFRDAVLPPLEREVAEAVLATGPADARDIRRLTGRRDTAAVNRAIDSLQRQLVLTRAGTVERDRSWPATVYDVLPRRYPLPELPAPDRARADLAAVLLRSAGRLTAADLSRALGFPRRDAGRVLEGLVAEGRARLGQESGLPVWTSRARSAACAHPPA